MIDKKIFGEIIKKNILKKYPEESFGYKTFHSKKEKVYPDYFSNDRFKKFSDEMKEKYEKFFDFFYMGKGSELKVKCVGEKTFPPKMASVASSSRFCYLALRNGGKALGALTSETVFEKGLPIKGVRGTAPQMDAWFEDECIFVEAKCQEIFDDHPIKFKKAYAELIYGQDNKFGFAKKDIIETEFTIDESAFGIEGNSMFDIKQLFCHLLGIESYMKENGKKQATLVYMFFKPECKDEREQMLIEDVFKKLQEEISEIFKSAPVKNFCAANNICLRAVAECSETMELLSEDNIRNLI